MTYLTENFTMDNYSPFLSNVPNPVIKLTEPDPEPTPPCENAQSGTGNKTVGAEVSQKELFLFEDIYNKHIRQVTLFAYNYLNDMDEAKNIAHDTFIAFWKNKKNVNLKDNVLPYLLATTKNRCLNALRKKEYSQQYTEHTIKAKTDMLNTIALENISSIKIYESDVERIISHGMNLMKPKVRQTFFLSRMSGLKNREIAHAEGIAESTVEARISSALLVMRRLLKDYL